MEIELQLPNGKDYLSPSSSKKLYKHPMSYLEYAKNNFKPSDEMIFGQYYEDMLYSENLNKYYILDDEAIIEKAVKERGSESANIRATKEYKSYKAEALEESKGKVVLSKEKVDIANTMKDIMVSSKVFDEHLDGDTQVEMSSYINTDEFIVNALVRSDVVKKKGKLVVNDLKTTSTEIDKWLYQAKKLDYDIQAYLTYEVWNADDFNFIVQRTQGLHDIGIFNVARGGWFWESGRAKFNKAVNNYIDFISPESLALGINPSHYIFSMQM